MCNISSHTCTRTWNAKTNADWTTLFAVTMSPNEPHIPPKYTISDFTGSHRLPFVSHATVKPFRHTIPLAWGRISLATPIKMSPVTIEPAAQRNYAGCGSIPTILSAVDRVLSLELVRGLVSVGKEWKKGAVSCACLIRVNSNHMMRIFQRYWRLHMIKARAENDQQIRYRASRWESVH